LIDPTRPCRACRRKAAAKAERVRVSEAKRTAYAHLRNTLQAEVPPGSLPPVTNLISGTDPALEALSELLRAARTQAERLYPDIWPFHPKNPQRSTPTDRTAEYACYLYSLYSLRRRIFARARDARLADLDNPIMRVDASRMHWRAYIPIADVHALNNIAAEVNSVRPTTRGRPFTGLPAWRTPRADSFNNKATTTDPETGEILPLANATATRGEVLCAAAWEPLRYSIEHTLKASKSNVRNRTRDRVNGRKIAFKVRTPEGIYTEENTGNKFTMEMFHMARIKAGEIALRNIDAAIITQQHPLEWTAPWADPPGTITPVTRWSLLVPPLLREELRDMFAALPEKLRGRMQMFPKYDKRTPQQRHLNLTAFNTLNPQPPPALRASTIFSEEE